ncbi:MAG: Uma2 family endonuclease [Pyrinomonadaceae bacterium]|nr:Uma2 family endonuclease [Pyrinomonadaceae bacterium]
MNLRTNLRTSKTNYAFTDGEIFYPESDGEPMAETDKHRNLLFELVEGLKRFYAEDDEVYVTGNLLFYFIEGVPEECVAPDVMVCFGVPKGDRRIYKLWEEKVTPSVVIELASLSTFKKDRTDKRELYESLGIKEYFIYNPDYPKTLPPLVGYRLNNGEYEKLRVENDRVFSEILGLELVDTGDTLRLFNSPTNNFLPNFAELASAEGRARTAEAEIKRLKAELEQLRIQYQG